MRIALILLIIVVCALSFSECKRKKTKKYFTKKALKKAGKRNPKILSGPHGTNPALTGLEINRPSSLSQKGYPYGIRSKVKFGRRNRNQITDANFGPKPVAPRRVPPKKVISPPNSDPPNPNLANPPPQSLQDLSKREKTQIAQVSFLSIEVLFRNNCFGGGKGAN